MMYYDIREPVKVKNITLSSKSTDGVDSLYLAGVQRGASKGHGIIRINLNQVCGHANYNLLGVLVPGYRKFQQVYIYM